MKEMNKKIKHSFLLNTKRYRVRRKGNGIISSMENTDLDLYNRQNTSSNQEKFEFYPFKSYWFYRLRFFISKKKQNNPLIINNFKKVTNSWLFKTIVGALILYVIKIIFKIEL